MSNSAPSSPSRSEVSVKKEFFLNAFQQPKSPRTSNDANSPNCSSVPSSPTSRLVEQRQQELWMNKAAAKAEARSVPSSPRSHELVDKRHEWIESFKNTMKQASTKFDEGLYKITDAISPRDDDGDDDDSSSDSSVDEETNITMSSDNQLVVTATTSDDMSDENKEHLDGSLAGIRDCEDLRTQIRLPSALLNQANTSSSEYEDDYSVDVLSAIPEVNTAEISDQEDIVTSTTTRVQTTDLVFLGDIESPHHFLGNKKPEGISHDVSDEEEAVVEIVDGNDSKEESGSEGAVIDGSIEVSAKATMRGLNFDVISPHEQSEPKAEIIVESIQDVVKDRLEQFTKTSTAASPLPVNRTAPENNGTNDSMDFLFTRKGTSIVDHVRRTSQKFQQAKEELLKDGLLDDILLLKGSASVEKVNEDEEEQHGKSEYPTELTEDLNDVSEAGMDEIIRVPTTEDPKGKPEATDTAVVQTQCLDSCIIL
jgi:hypothetical protein